MTGSEDVPAGGIYFEFTPVGASVKVVAIDAATGTEVSVIGLGSSCAGRPAAVGPAKAQDPSRAGR